MSIRTKPTDPDLASAANLGLKAKLRLAAEKLHNDMDAAENRHLRLIFLKYIPDTSDELTAPLMAKIIANWTESRTLVSLHKTPLPKPLSGELSVAGAEQLDGRIA